jgi:hypothetical protein
VARIPSDFDFDGDERLGKFLERLGGGRMTLKSDIKLKAVILTGDARYEKDLSFFHWSDTIETICTRTREQLHSEEYILGKGFKKVND